LPQEPNNGMFIAVTGASGFLGRFVVPHLLQQGLRVRAWTRGPAGGAPSGADCMSGDLSDSKNMDRLLTGADVVLHLAGRAHVADRTAARRQEFIDVNVGLTAQLAQAAAGRGVRRFVFASSIGVLGSSVPAAERLTEASVPNPDGSYARSKLAAEEKLLAVASRSALQVTIVRPTLVFGPGAPGNVHRLVRLAASGLPLPFGNLSGKRSFIGVRNLAELFGMCCTHPVAGGQLFVAADDSTLSLPEILQALGRGLRQRVRVWSMPRSILRMAAGLVGRSADLAKMSAPLVVDASKAKTLLGWSSHQTLYDSICETAAQYRSDTMR
jgi:nucleoside-diphosphate-sugar epimerase